MQGRIDRKVEIIVVGIVTNPANTPLFIVKAFSERVDEGIKPPRMFHKFSESILTVNRAVEDLAIKPVLIAKNR